jgi:hypothetical protein
LSPILRRPTTDKRVLSIDEPLSTKAGKPALYRIADSNLRLYLAALRTAQELSRRGRPEAAFRVVERRWSSWRGRAVEPVIREALELAAADGHLPRPDVDVVGGWWNRQFDPEVDLVGADRAPVAHRVDFVGSVKWLASAFDNRDLGALRAAALQVPGCEPGRTGLVVVSRAGAIAEADRGGVEILWGPNEVISAWR